MGRSTNDGRPARVRRPICACPLDRCQGRVTQPGGGWDCRALRLLGVLADEPAKAAPRGTRSPGWSRNAVIPCPSCGNRPYTEPPEGFPWRRCEGPRGCGQVFNAEARLAVMPETAPPASHGSPSAAKPESRLSGDGARPPGAATAVSEARGGQSTLFALEPPARQPAKRAAAGGR